MAKGWSQEDISFLHENYLIMDDKQIADRLGKSERSVSYHRQKNGLNKKAGRPSPTIDEGVVTPKNLTKEDKKNIEKTRLIKSDDYKMLQFQFSSEELEMYVEKYVDYISDWDSVTPQERDQLHALIKEVLIQNNALSKIKSQEQLRIKIADLNEKISELIDNGVEEDSKEIISIKNIRSSHIALLEPTDSLYKIYKESSERYDKTSKTLKITREQRLKDKQDSNLSILTIAQHLNDEVKRKQMGEEIAILNKSKEMKKTELKEKNIVFGDF